MTEHQYDYADPRRLFALYKELTGEDILGSLSGSKDPNEKQASKTQKNTRVEKK